MLDEVFGVVGAGFMGTGITESAARAGFDVVLYEPTAAPLERSASRIEESLARAVERGKLAAGEADQITGRVTRTTEMADLARCTVVIEAVTEDLAIKGPLFGTLDELLAPSALLASNTSSIPIAQLAARTTDPGRVLGLHFFSPVPLMALAEVVVGLDTRAEVVDRASSLVEKLGKSPIRTKDRAGFVVNMLLVPYLMAAVRMLEEGFASREDIDMGMRLGAGHPMGPLTLCDFIGLDVLEAVCCSLFEEYKRPDYSPPPLLRRMVTAGHHGRKTDSGFYDYGPQKHAKAPPENMRMAAVDSAAAG